MRTILIILSLLLFAVNVSGQTNNSVTVSFLKGEHSLVSSAPYTLIEAAEKAYKEMQKGAKAEGVQMRIISSFRSYADQKRIWNSKYKRFINEGLSPQKAIQKIIQYSTLPGTSRHHWGTDIDLIDPDPVIKGDVLLEQHFHAGPYQKLREWLEENAHQFGFYLVYTQDSLRQGFKYEPWHYSYYPKSKDFLNEYILQCVLEDIKKDTLLLGHQYLDQQFIEKYKEENILGINPLLKTWD